LETVYRFLFSLRGVWRPGLCALLSFLLNVPIRKIIDIQFRDVDLGGLRADSLSYTLLNPPEVFIQSYASVTDGEISSLRVRLDTGEIVSEGRMTPPSNSYAEAQFGRIFAFSVEKLELSIVEGAEKRHIAYIPFSDRAEGIFTTIRMDQDFNVYFSYEKKLFKYRLA
jgi:hypothetical protein